MRSIQSLKKAGLSFNLHLPVSLNAATRKKHLNGAIRFLSLQQMHTNLSHLSQSRRQQVHDIVNIIMEVIVPDKIILFGSYARGNYIEHRYTGQDGVVYEYISDFDFLVITTHSVKSTAAFEDVVMSRTQYMKQAVNMLIHDIGFINSNLEKGNYFFTEVITKGILLHDSGETALLAPRVLSQEETNALRRSHFERWLKRGDEFLIDARQAFGRGSFIHAVFYLHQAAESFYYTMLLMHSGYKPKTHNLYKLRRQTKPFSEALFQIFAVEESGDELRLFELLKGGYIEARYHEDEYKISNKDLAVLIERTETMRRIVADSGAAFLDHD